jgi:hypothetical protein
VEAFLRLPLGRRGKVLILEQVANRFGDNRLEHHEFTARRARAGLGEKPDGRPETGLTGGAAEGNPGTHKFLLRWEEMGQTFDAVTPPFCFGPSIGYFQE